MKRIFLLLSLLAASQVYGQRIKYEDELHRILTLPVSSSVAELKIWLAQEPTNPSIFLQLGLLYEKRYKNSDPLKDFDYKYGNAKLALSAFERTEQFLTEKEVRKNEESYYNFGVYDAKGKFNVPYDSVTSRITRSKAELAVFIENIPNIYEQFTQSFSHYDQAYKTYASILGTYPTFKELYLLYNEDVDLEFEKLKTEYQTAMGHFEKYKTAIQTFDIGYNQNLKVDKVSVYRLDGLESQINFLDKQIRVWDYAKWVDTTRLMINKEIGNLRTSLAAESLRIDGKLEAAIPDFIRDSFEPLTVSKEVLFNLRKYDLNSVIEPIFIYKQRKHDLIYQDLLSESIDTSATVDVERKLYLYGQMINKIKLADSTLSDVLRKNTDISYKKYSSVIETHYQGITGVKTYVGKEQTNNANYVKDAVRKIQENIYQKLSKDTVQENFALNKKSIPLFISEPLENEFVTKDLITTHRLNTFDGSAILGGISKNEKESKTQAFVCGVTADKKGGWFNEYLLQQDSSVGYDSHTRLAALTFVPGGIALILNGVDTSGTQRMNHLLLLDEAGAVVLSRRLLFNQFPRTLSYSSKNNSLLITYKGMEFSDTILLESELSIASYNILGDLQWQKRMSYKGDVAGVIEVDQSFILTGNYNEMKGLDGRINRAGVGNTESKPFVLKLNSEGEITELKTIENASSIFVNTVYKVSDDCINLFGSKGDYRKTLGLDTDPSNSLHVIINSDLEVLSSSLN